MSGKIKNFPADYIGIYYPKKGFRRFLGIPFIIPAALSAVNILMTLLIRSSGDEALQEFIVLQAFLAACAIPSFTVIADVIREGMATKGYGGKSPKRLLLLRCAPEMERVIKCAFIADEARRLGLYIVISALAGAALALTEQSEAVNIIPAMAFTAAVMYLAAVMAVLFVRFIDNGMAMFMLAYFWLMIVGLAAMFVQDGILSGDIPGAVTFVVLIPGAAAGILTCRAAVHRACLCRFPESK